MGRKVVYCSVCGVRLLDRDFESAGAVVIDGRNFCSTCRETVDPGGAEREASPSRTIRPSTRRVSRVSQKHRPSTRRTARRLAASRSSSTALIVGGVVGGLLLILLVAGMNSSPSPAPNVTEPVEDNSSSSSVPRSTTPPPEPVTPEPPPETPEKPEKKEDDPREREDKARAAFEELKTFAAENPDDPEAIISRIHSAFPQMENTTIESQVLEILEDTQRLVDQKRAEKQIESLLEGLKEHLTKDPEFKEHAEAVRKISEARRISEKFAPDFLVKIAEAEQEYDTVRNKAAFAVGKTVMARAEEEYKKGDLKACIDALGTLPDAFAGTSADDQINAKEKEIRAEYDKIRKHPRLDNLADQAYAHYQNDNYAKGAKMYVELVNLIQSKPLKMYQGISNKEYQRMVRTAYYNIACYYSKEKSDVDNACKYLKGCLDNGYNNWDHISKDPDWDNIKDSAKFKELLKSYQ
jgi:hypothetical protein